MKAVVVVALIALCACAFELPKKPTFAKIPKVVRDDPEIKYFTPKDLPCAFHLDYKVYTDPTSDYDFKGTIYVGGNHSCISYKAKSGGYEVKFKDIVRADIKDADGDICYVETQHYEYNGQEVNFCTFNFIDPEHTSNTAELMREALTSPLPYTSVEKDVKWTSDMTCDLYKWSDEYATYFQFCVDDDRVVGMDDAPYRYAFDEYEKNAGADEFAVSSKYEGCEEQKKIYEDAEPVPADCELKGAASAVKAVAAVVLAMMALFF